MSGPMSYYSGQRMAQPTTTTTQPMSFMDYLGIPLGLASAGASIYGGITTANAWDKMASNGGFPSYTRV
jgi:F0F1-type ATP synthase membrane subunit c/vacuolar-type H+-ATPase subunit K